MTEKLQPEPLTVEQDQQAPPKEAGYDPSSGLSYKEYLEQGGELGSNFRNSLQSPEPSVSKSRKIPVRPVEEGELSDIYEEDKAKGIAVDAEDELRDDIPLTSLAAMGHEPWTLDIDNQPSKDPETPPKSPPSDEVPPTSDNPDEVEPNDDNAEHTPEPPDKPSDSDNDSELPPSVSEPVDIPDEDKDPPQRIGEVIEDRIAELKQSGESESDAHAQAHDEFWGREFKDDAEPSQEPGLEQISSPELDAALATLDESRSELARLRAGRESATFLSRKYSKKKLAEAFEKYEEAKAEAGAIAVDLLRQRGLEGKDIVSSINFGSLDETLKLISEQYDIEVSNVESKRLKGFYEWWNKQGTKLFSMGTLKKGAVMAAIGAPIGAAVGIAGIVAAPVIGAGVAAGAGLAAARSITRGLVGNAVRKNAEAANVAEAKAQQRREQAQEIFAEMDSHIDRVASELTSNEELVAYAQQQEGIHDNQAKQQTADVKKGNDKRAAISMAVAAGSATLAYLAVDFITSNGPDTPPPYTPPKPPEPEYNPNTDRFIGVTESSPNAPEQAANFFGNIEPDTPQSPELQQIDQIWESVKDQLSPQQDRVYNQVLGRLSATEGYGNGWSIQNSDQILDLVKQGNNVEQVMNQLGVPAS